MLYDMRLLLQDSFIQFDKDKSGTIDTYELRDSLASLGTYTILMILLTKLLFQNDTHALKSYRPNCFVQQSIIYVTGKTYIVLHNHIIYRLF